MNKIYSVYAIQSKKDNRIYVGLSENIQRRVREHNNGRVRSTKAYRPWQLIYQESVGDRIDARRKERYLKSGFGKEFLKTLKIK